MTSLLLDLRHATRVLAKNLGATSVAVFTLALAIGATTAIFSVVYGVLLRPLPYPAPDRLMAVWEVNHRGTYSRLADPNFDDFRDRNRTFARDGEVHRLRHARSSAPLNRRARRSRR